MIDSRHRFDLLVEKCVNQGHVPTEEEKAMTILDALPKEMSSLVDTFYTNDPLPVSNWLWMRLLERELGDRKRENRELATSFSGLRLYGSGRGRGDSASQYERGGGRLKNGGGGGGANNAGGENQNETNSGCFRCGSDSHWNKDCPHKAEKCTYCGGVGHLEKRCHDRQSGYPKGRKMEVKRESGGESSKVDPAAENFE